MGVLTEVGLLTTILWFAQSRWTWSSCVVAAVISQGPQWT